MERSTTTVLLTDEDPSGEDREIAPASSTATEESGELTAGERASLSTVVADPLQDLSSQTLPFGLVFERRFLLTCDEDSGEPTFAFVTPTGIVEMAPPMMSSGTIGGSTLEMTTTGWWLWKDSDAEWD